MNSEPRKDLARYQEALLSQLFGHSQAPEIILAMNKDLKGTKWDGYLNNADPDVLEMAALIFKKWGCHGGPECQHR